MREIEIKLKVRNPEQIEHELQKQGCVLSSPIHQHDVVYSVGGATDAWEMPKAGDIVLRIRREGDKAIFTLKQQLTNELDNTELETEVSDPERMHQALELLGCRPVVEVKKSRRKGKLGEYEICFDQVEKLGAFVEIEKLTDESADPAIVSEELFKIAEELGLSREDQELRGYDTQLFNLERRSEV